MAFEGAFTHLVSVGRQQPADDGQGAFGSDLLAPLGELRGRVVPVSKGFGRPQRGGKRVNAVGHEFYGYTDFLLRAGDVLRHGGRDYLVTGATVLREDIQQATLEEQPWPS